MKRHSISILFISFVFCLLGQDQEDRMDFRFLCAGSILEIYQIIYRDVHPTRFIYDSKEKLDSLYHLAFKDYGIFINGEDLYWRRLKVINEFDSIFGLKTRVLKKDVKVLVLDSINAIYPPNISIDSINKITSNFIIYTWGSSLTRKREWGTTINHLSRFRVSYWQTSTRHIAGNLEAFFLIPVEICPLSRHIAPTQWLDINLDIERNFEGSLSDKINLWIETFKEVGIYLRVEKRIEKHVEIKKHP